MEINQIFNFDDIRPYEDEEVNAAMKRIAQSDFFPMISTFVYPERPIEEVRKQLCSYECIRDFQHQVMFHANEQIIARSIDKLTSAGFDYLDKNRSYMYVSNHRDIMLDAALLQNLLIERGFETTEITFGANLMMNPLVIDLGKSNRMFKVERPSSSIKEFYHASQHLSEYIRYTIREKHHSVWIAQRNGRTKNGIDATDQGIIKMFCMSEPENKVKALDELHIVPVAVSYEWESCDILKTIELLESRGTKYIKKPGEDLNSILTGIVQTKGRVHIEICPPIEKSELRALDGLTKTEYHRAVSQLLDRRINLAYRLYPNNYIAHDLLYGNEQYVDEYTPEQKEKFLKRLHLLDQYEDADLEALREIFLGIYANPVDSKNNL